MRGVQHWTNINRSWANTGGPVPPQGNPIGVAPEFYKIDTDSEGSDEIYGKELEITTPIQERRIQFTSLSPVTASTTIHKVIRSPQPPQTPIRSPARPSTFASTSTNIQPPMASTSRDPISSEPESVFDHR
ncbi:hypothetical protein O181_036785 [Austropuccinia psidii MF-1]|uniref:Uncharacterized protein n=1 Tax=Austropuccinia psidii MF-1 TaxID=1389203 RepID=A0A9Q3D737_9BASI|nr:hypothetical protein [Austropuccinia psidii MF-1]